MGRDTFHHSKMLKAPSHLALNAAREGGFGFCLFVFVFSWREASPTAVLHGEVLPLGGCGVSFSGDIQDPPGQGAVQLAAGDPASAGGLD